jgi:thiamine-monophosphate kinase
MRLKDIGEIKLIEHIAKEIKTDSSVVKGIGDDAAVIEFTKDKYLLYTCDMLVEGVHFTLPAASSFQIGWKALARNLSDIAAMGGVGRYAVVSIAVDPEMKISFIDGIYRGVKAVARRFKVNIVGGDLSKSKKVVISIALIGEVEKRSLVTRSGAKVGDAIFVTGSFGGSMRRKHLIFTPRIEEARFLVNNFNISSMIDVSDGLALDLSRIIKASNVGAIIYKKLVPLSKDAVSFEKAIKEGEDFELLFTMNPDEVDRLVRLSRSKIRTRITRIGKVVAAQNGIKLVIGCVGKKRIDPKGYLHF